MAATQADERDGHCLGELGPVWQACVDICCVHAKYAGVRARRARGERENEPTRRGIARVRHLSPGRPLCHSSARSVREAKAETRTRIRHIIEVMARHGRVALSA